MTVADGPLGSSTRVTRTLAQSSWRCSSDWMETETMIDEPASSVNPDGVREREVVETLAADVGGERGQARRFAARIKVLCGVMPGSQAFLRELEADGRA